jgi:signal transduction histidine kinase
MSPASVRRFAPAAMYCTLAVITAVIVRANPELALAGSSKLALAAELVAGGLLVVPALAGGGRFAALLAAAGLVWLLAEWSSPAAGWAFTPGLVLAAAWPPLLAAAVLCGPDERPLRSRARGVVAAGLLANLGVLGLLSAALFDPVAQGCTQCPANVLFIGGDAAAWHRAGQVGLALAAAASGAFAVLALAGLPRATPAGRRRAAPVLLPAVAASALFGAEALHGLARGYLSTDPTDRSLRLAQSAAMALVAAGVALAALHARRTRARLAGLVIELGSAPSPGGLRDRLAAALGDPSLQLLFARDGDWVDPSGRTVTPEPRPGRDVTRLTIAGEEVCAVLHRSRLLDDPALVVELARGARLAIEHERLHTLRRARLEELRASRARIVAAADAERRRLERNLLDGAQQRLVALAVGIRLLRRRLGGDRPCLERELADSEEQLTLAVDELRAVAQGLFPLVLGEEGLAAALEVLAEEDVRLVAGELPDHRCAPPVESAAYYLVAQTLRLASDGDVTVDVRHDGSRLLVDVRTCDTPIDGVPARVHDRVGAVGGTLATEPGHLHAELPCVS